MKIALPPCRPSQVVETVPNLQMLTEHGMHGQLDSFTCSAAVRRPSSTILHRLLSPARFSAGSAVVHCVHGVPCWCSQIKSIKSNVFNSDNKVHIK